MLVKELEREIRALKRDIEKKLDLKQKLVELGIAKDDGKSNVIKIIDFVRYLRYLEHNPNIKI